ncbi:MAG: hypothetical protein DYG92_07745 [Leptolyngbya sp. PLA1]|nr:hypothetical protein [Leptolyngbya sp. PLA1]
MSSIPSNLSRMPNLLRNAASARQINSTNVELMRVQQQIAGGVELLRPSDDIVRAAAIGVLDERLARSVQVVRNLSHADAALGVLDDLFKEAHDTVLAAKGIASAQSNATSSASERAAQAVVIDQMLAGLFNTANRESVAGYALSGSRTSVRPVEAFLSGYRYMGDGPGLVTDIGQASTTPITLGGGNAIIGTSARVRGAVDLDPVLTAGTRLSDLDGARGLGVTTGVVRMRIDGGTEIEVDLAGADTVGDVVTRIDAAVRAHEAAQSVTVLGPGGVSLAGGSLTIDVASGHTIEFGEEPGGTAARDLGLAGDTPVVFSPTSASGLDTAPRLTWRTAVADLAGLTAPLGSIRLSNGGRSGVVDLSGAQTLGDVRNLLEAAGLGVRVRINEAGDGIDVLNEVAAASSNALSISEAGGTTAAALGVRTVSLGTRISDFNFGRGVEIVDGQNDPTTGQPSASLNTDLRIKLGDAAGTTIDVDLRPEDMADVTTLLARINSEIAAGLAAASLPSTALRAELSATTNGLALVQDAGFPGALAVEPRNNSRAAEMLGLMDGTYDAGSATFTGEERTKVRVESAFTYMLDLRAALIGNDVFGIALAAQDLEASAGELVETRGLLGGYATRIEDASTRETDRQVLDEGTRSLLRDTDFTKAASRLTLLQTQLQAAFQVTAALNSRSLLDFLG